MKKFAAIIVMILCVGLFACSRDNQTDNPVNGGNSGDAETPGNTGADEIEPQNQKLEPDLPETDLGGAVINFLVKGEDHHWYWSSKEIYAEEETGEPVNDAVYRRNRYIEAKYNFSVTEYRSGNPSGDAMQAVRAGDDEYDVFMLGLTDGANLAQGGYLVNLNSAPHINLTQPWWDQRAIKDLTMKDAKKPRSSRLTV